MIAEVQMEITFLGAARTVTGSSFLLEHNGFSVLVDLGLPQGSDERKMGEDLPISPASVDAVVLTVASFSISRLVISASSVKDTRPSPATATSANPSVCPLS